MGFSTLNRFQVDSEKSSDRSVFVYAKLRDDSRLDELQFSHLAFAEDSRMFRLVNLGVNLYVDVSGVSPSSCEDLHRKYFTQMNWVYCCAYTIVRLDVTDI